MACHSFCGPWDLSLSSFKKKEEKEGTKCNQGSLLPFLGNLHPVLGVGSGCTQFSTLG